VKVTYQGFQPTDLSPAPGAAAEAAPAPGGAAVRSTRTPARGEPRRVGVVFVHGIGTQKPAETFLDWSSAIVRILSEWRLEQGFGVDPVIRSQFAFDPGALPFLELDIPEYGGRKASTWVLTEALWAEAIRAPTLDPAAAYLGDRLRTIVLGIRAGYKMREPKWDERAERLPELERWRWRWIGAIDWLQRTFLTQWLFVLPVVAIGSLLLLLWAPLRRLPIGPLRDFVDAKIVDSFITDWFGDLPALLDDPVQAANVRARVAETVAGLRRLRCDSIVLIAHSGGAIVAFETLLDPAYLDDPRRRIEVDKLITHGEGLNLGWRLERAYKQQLDKGHRLQGNLGTSRPDLRWVDVWASFDPAPPGPLHPPPGVRLLIGQTGEPGKTGNEAAGDMVIESRPVTNFMSLRQDHGGYWANDEGFLVPLLRHIDDARGWGGASRFYADRNVRTVRIERRRQRVAVLGAWRWIVALGAVAAILAGGLAAGALRLAGETLIEIWSRVPGAALISAPVDAVWGALGTVLSLLPFGATAVELPRIGPVVLGGSVIVALFLGLSSTGGWAWGRWDERERAAARRERLPALDRQFAIAAFMTLTVAVVSLVVAAMNAGNQGRVFALLLGGIGLGILASIIVLMAFRLAAPEIAPEAEEAAGTANVKPPRDSATAAPETSAVTAAAPPKRPPKAQPPANAESPAKAASPTGVKRRPAPGTPRTPPAAPRTSRRGSRTPPRSGGSEA
jgi:hypothetical protein